MEKQQHRISIDAPKEKVWKTLWNKDSYKQWTSAFAEGSTVETDNWKKGSKVLFLDGNGSGMVSEVEENIPNQHMSFKHLGEVKNGVEDTTSEKVAPWSGSHENYTLNENNGKTEVLVEMDISEDFAEMFAALWPKALGKLKRAFREITHEQGRSGK